MRDRSMSYVRLLNDWDTRRGQCWGETGGVDWGVTGAETPLGPAVRSRKEPLLDGGADEPPFFKQTHSSLLTYIFFISISIYLSILCITNLHMSNERKRIFHTKQKQRRAVRLIGDPALTDPHVSLALRRSSPFFLFFIRRYYHGFCSDEIK